MGNIVDKKTASDLMDKCRKALDEVLSKEGFEITKFSGKFGDSFGMNISAIPSVKNEFGLNPNSQQVIDYERYHQLFNLAPNALGVDFTVGTKSYTFEGVEMSRRKHPIAVATPDGKKVLLTTDPRVIQAINDAAQLRATSDSTTKAPASRKPKA